MLAPAGGAVAVATDVATRTALLSRFNEHENGKRHERYYNDYNEDIPKIHTAKPPNTR